MMRLYCKYILIAVILYLRKGQAIPTEEINGTSDIRLIQKLLTYGRAISPFQHLDYHYNNIINSVDNHLLKQAEDYADTFLKENHNFANQEKWPMARDDMIYHYLYFSSTLKHMNPQNEDQIKIYINIFLMMGAYDAALDFRVCVLYYSTSFPKIEKRRIKLCQEMFEYMEWFFLFMKDEKLKGFCEINGYPQQEKCTPPSTAQFTAKDACKRLQKVNLNFLKTQNEVNHIPPLQKDSYNVFKPEILNEINPDTHELYFKPLFPNGVVNDITDRYGKNLYETILSRIEFTYTEEFFKIRRYLRAIYRHVAFDDHLHSELFWERSWEFNLLVWGRIKNYKDITELPVKTPRQTKSNHGETILRSNAVEILRTRLTQVFHMIPPRIPKDEEILNISNSNISIYFLTCAPENLGVDYFYTSFYIKTN